MLSLAASMQLANAFLSRVIGNNVYSATLFFMPGFVFLIMAAIFIFGMFITL